MIASLENVLSNGLLNLATANNSLLSLYNPTVVINVLGSLKYVGCTKEPSEAVKKVGLVEKLNCLFPALTK